MTRAPIRKGGSRPSTGNLTVPPPAPLAVEDAWVEVEDKPSGLKYFWNTETNETTALGAPKPTGVAAEQAAQPPAQSGGMMSGLGRVVAEGFAFGVGSSIAHSMVGSMFGGSSSSNSSSDDASGGDDSFDI